MSGSLRLGERPRSLFFKECVSLKVWKLEFCFWGGREGSGLSILSLDERA